jgi:hypothetical protein
LIGKETTTKSHLVAVAAGTHGSQKQDSATIGRRTIIGGDNEQVGKSVAGNGVDGYMVAGIEVRKAGTIGAGVDGSSDWQMR